MSSVRLFVDEAQTAEVNNRSSPTDEGSCGQICSTEFSSKQDGRYYPLLRKHVDCSVIMQRMAREPAALHPPRYPPPDTIDNFTQHGQCQLKFLYYDYSRYARSNQSSVILESTIDQLMKADLSGKKIIRYNDPYRRLKPTLTRYQDHIQNASVAVVGTENPWAEAMLLNIGARHITTLEYRRLVMQHSRVVAITPSQFAKNFLDATKNAKTVRLSAACFVLHDLCA